MKIGLFTDTYYPEINGVAASVFLLRQELEKRGHEVYVFTTTSPGSPQNEEHVYRVPSLPCFFLSERRVGMFYQHKLDSIIRRLQLDVIHTHTEFALGIFGRIVAAEHKIPTVHTYHTIYEDYTHYIMPIRVLDDGVKAFARRYSKFFCNHGGHVIVPTEKVKHLLERYQVKTEISVIPTGIDLSKFDRGRYGEEVLSAKRAEVGLAGTEKVILYVGRVAREKNIEELIKMMPAFFATHEDTRFLVIGDGPALGELKRLAEKENISGQMIFAGAKPWDEIGAYYALGDVFVSASQSETQGLTYIEAMAAGLPVVAKKDDCLQDVLQNGKNGFLFETQEEFLSGLEAVLYGENREAYRKTAKEAAVPYSKEVYAERIEQIYLQK
ncbi:MAG: glycosyltransferase family 4 protein [Lachnospiraceae bacterium]